MSDKEIQHLPQGSVITSAKGKRYIIERMIGHGAFGITYLAQTTETSPDLGETTYKVAIKEFFMHDYNSRDDSGRLTDMSKESMIEQYKANFRKEANNLKNLNHPNIVKVYDIISQNNTYYIVMQFIDGDDLDKYIAKRNGMPEYEALEKTRDIALALAYMHDHKMLHLDLKPKNIMLDSEGNVHIIDFGLSKQYDDNGEPESSTTIGTGTQGYAPTEQIDRDGATFRPTIDVYALGATFYKMLTSKTPPNATTILNDPASLAKNLKANGVSPALSQIVQNAMKPAYGERIQNMRELVRQIDHQLMLRGADVTADDDNTTIDTASAKNKGIKKGDNKNKAQLTSNESGNALIATLRKNWPYYTIGIVVGVAVVLLVSLLSRPSTPKTSDAELNAPHYQTLVARCDQLINNGQASDLIEAKNLILDSIAPLEAAYSNDLPDTYNAMSRLSGRRLKKAAPLAQQYAAKAKEQAEPYIDALSFNDGSEQDFLAERNEALKLYRIAIQLDESNDTILRQYNNLNKQ